MKNKRRRIIEEFIRESRKLKKKKDFLYHPTPNSVIVVGISTLHYENWNKGFETEDFNKIPLWIIQETIEKIKEKIDWGI